MAVITYTDVETAIGRPISEVSEQDQVTQWIADVEMILASRIDVEALDEGVQTDLVAYVVREAVIARMRFRADRNGDNTRGENDPDTGEESFFLRVLSPWWALLDPGESGSPVFSARPYFEADTSYSVSAWETA